MATTTNKQRVLTQFFSLLKSCDPELEGRPVLEQFIYGVCREDATREQADLDSIGLMRARLGVIA